MSARRSLHTSPHILVCGWAGAGNVGDELLTRWIVAAIEAAGATAVVASRDLEDTRRRHPSTLATRWGPRDLGRACGVDGVVVGPGGIIQDSSSVWSLPGHLVKALVARRRGVPIAAVGVGAETLRRRSSRWLLRRALGDAVAVVCRDEASAAAVRAAGVAASTAIDVVFDLEFPTPDPKGEIVVALGPSVLGGSIRPAAGRLDDGDLVEVAAALDGLARRFDAPLAFCAFRGQRDRHHVARLLRLLTASARVVPDDVDAQCEAVSAARLVVTSRYHAAVIGVRVGVPVVVVSGEAKLAALAEQVADVDRLRSLGSWAELAEIPLGGPLMRGVVPGSLDEAHKAVSELLSAATRRWRPPRSGG